MRRERWSWARLYGPAALLVASGCLGSSGGGGCDGPHNGALDQGDFTYVCPTPSDPSLPNPDASCGRQGGSSSTTMPTVAVGAPFRLEFNGASGAAPQPAVASLAQSSPEGWALLQPGWLGFIEWSGADVLDFTHVAAAGIAAIQFEPVAPITVGDDVTVAVDPLDASGSILGGLITCTFTSSDASVLSVSPTGNRVARIAAVMAGDATLSASCMGVESQLALHVSGSGSVPGDASDDVADGDDAGEADAGGPEDDASDTSFDGAPADTSDATDAPLTGGD